MAASAYNDTVQKVYIAYYGRAADPVGLAYWSKEIDDAGGSLSSIMASFGASAEATTLYGSLSNTAKVNALFQQSFGRDADFAGLMYYAGQLTAGTMTAASIAQNIFDGATGTDATILSNKLTVAKAYTAAIDTAGEVVAYAGTVAAASARTLLATVDAATVTASFDVATSVANIVTASAATPAVASTTVALTTSVDSLVSSGAGQYIANSVMVTNAAVTGTTAQAGDSITGGTATNDTLNISLTGDGTNDTLNAVQTSGIENLLISDYRTAGGDSTFDTALMTGLTTIGSSSSAGTGDAVFTNIKNIVDSQMKNGEGDITLTYGATVVAGTADTQKLTVSNMTGGDFTANSMETVEVTTDLVKSTLNSVVGDAMATLKILGDQDLVITTGVDFAGTGTLAGTVDASAFTGKLSITQAVAEDTTITGGTGNDTFTYGTRLTAVDVLDGGAGTDTLSVNQDTFTEATYTKVSNVETLKAEATAGNTLTVAAAGSAAFTTLQLVENNTDNNDISVTGMAAGTKVELVSDVNGAQMGDVTLALQDASGTSDELTITLKGTSGHAAADNLQDLITVGNVETINLVSSFTGTTAMLATDDNTITSLAIADTTTLNLSGAVEAAVTVATNTKLTTVDASAMTALATLTLSNVTTGTTVTTGSGADTIIMGTKLGNTDVIDGGANPSATSVDTLTATVTGLTATTGALTVSNVEALNFTNTGTAVINAAGITGANLIAVTGAAGTTTYTNLAEAAKVGLGFTDESGAAVTGTTTIGLADETGTANAVTVNLAEATSNTLKATAIETVNLAFNNTASIAVATTTLTVSALNASTINISGANADKGTVLALGTLDTDTTTVDGTSYKGVLQLTSGAAIPMAITASGAAVNTITTSTGSDTITLLGNLGATVNDITASTGTLDTLNVNINNAATRFDSIDGFETINLTVAASTATGIANTVAAMSGINEATTVNISGGNSLSSFANSTTGVIAVNTAATTIDASAFEGNITLNAAASGLNSFLTIKGGALTTDTVTMPVNTTVGTADKIAAMTGVETLTLTGVSDTANNQVDLTNVTGLVTLAPSMSVGQSHISVKGLDEAVKVKVTSATTLDNVVLALTGATGAANSLDVEMTATGAVGTHTLNLDVAGLETLNIASKDTDGTSVDLAGMVPTTGSTGTVNVTGAGALTITAMDTGINVIDASAATGALTVAAAARNADLYTITGGSGDDTIALENSGDILDGAAGTGDNLVVNFTAILGGINVDLSNTADVITSMDGGTNAAVQSNFESVDVSGFSGFGAVVVGNAGANTIVGAPAASNLTGAAGADIITGGAGADIIGGGAGDDVMVGAGGIDTITGGAGGDTITGGALADIIDSGAGNDSLVYLLTADLFNTQASVDTIVGGAGTDTLTVGTSGTAFAIAANDVFTTRITTVENITAVANSAAVTIDLDSTAASAGIINVDISAGTSATSNIIDASELTSTTTVLTLTGSATGATALTGGSGNDIITGGAVVDTVLGGAGNDTISTANGVDIITGGTGQDIITSGGGNDILNVGDSTDGNNVDTITDFVTVGDDIKALQSVFGWNSVDNTATVLLATGATIKAADDAGDSNIVTLSATIATHTYATYAAGTSTYAELEGTAITGMGLTGALDAAAVMLVAIDDGVTTGLWQFISGDTIDNAVAASEIELIGVLTGVANAAALVVGDFIFS